MPAFDTQQRLNVLKRFLEHLLAAGDGTIPRVLDVGGHPGLLAGELGGRLRTITVDCHEGPLENYLLASGCSLPFAEAAFEAAVASDVLEHVPHNRRQPFLTEMGRVSSGWVLVGGPFRSPDVAQAEASVNELTRLVRGRPDPWLEEHWQCGLPDLAETRRQLRETGFHSAVVPNGSLFSWLLLKEIELLLNALPDAFQQFEEINNLYLSLWSEVDHQRPTYRHLLVAHRDKKQIESLVQSPPSRCGLQFFGPDTDVPPCEEQTRRLRAVAKQFERLAESSKAVLGNTKDSIDSTYLSRLEAIVEGQERQRTALEEGLKRLGAQLERYESSRFIQLWKKLRWR